MYATAKSTLNEEFALISDLCNSVRGDPAMIDEQIHKLLVKNIHFQKSMEAVLKRWNLMQEIDRVTNEIKDADAQIASFVMQMYEMEEKLDESLTADEDRKSKKQSFTLDDVLVLAERLGHQSVSAADHLERHGASTAQPPGPQGGTIQASRLRLNLDELLIEQQRIKNGLDLVPPSEETTNDGAVNVTMGNGNVSMHPLDNLSSTQLQQQQAPTGWKQS